MTPSADDPSRTLFIVDDDRGARQSLRVVFKDDYRVVVAENAEQALEQARDHRVDVAILDIIMPEMSGIELLEQLKKLDSQVEVIMLTAYETVETARQAIRLGACDYLTKPFDLATVKESVSRAMEKRLLSEEVQTNSLKLKEIHREMQRYREEQELIRHQEEIYASIIHDLNSPLAVISGYIDLVNQQLQRIQRLEGEDLDGIRAKLDHVRRQAKNCVNLSRRYLNSLNEPANRERAIEVNDVLHDLELLLEGHRACQDHRLDVRPLEGGPAVEINGTELIQVLLNLTINGFQCTPEPHRVSVFGEVVDQPLAQSAPESGEDRNGRWLWGSRFANTPPFVALSVEDDGPGMEAAVLDKIFESRFTTKSVDQNSGLGLSIVKRVIAQSKGALHVVSRVDGGTRFTLYLAQADREDTE